MIAAQDGTVGSETASGELEVRDLHVFFGESEVLRGVEARFQPGKVTAIIGPSGCGKSTLLRSLNRLNETVPSARVAGYIGLDGQDIHRMDAIDLRARVGMVFQKPNPFPMSIRENVLYGVKANHLRVDHEHTVRTSLEKAALWEEVKARLKASGMSLSLGQQQRLCIARALAVSPEVVLMDEPAASLDPISTYHLENSILAMRGEFTVIIVTHDMQQARRVADNTMFMLAGEVVEYGPTPQLFESPGRQETRDYLSGRLLFSRQEQPAAPAAVAQA